MSAPDQESTVFSRFQLPGLNLPLNWTPHALYTKPILHENGEWIQTDFPAQGEKRNLFPTALNEANCADGAVSLRLTTLREFAMLQIMDVLTDKPNWEVKIFDDEIAARWKTEALTAPGRDVSQKMVDRVIGELRFQATNFHRTSAVIVFNGGVVKSDTAISEAIRESLKNAVKLLEDVPEIYKDYHPGSDGKVLDLVHPSLFPLIYGKSRVLEDSVTRLDNCMQSCGKGIVVPIRPDDECKLDRKGSFEQSGDWRWRSDDAIPYSKFFQWLPSEIEFDQDGKAKFSSYINNLHPQNHQNLYRIIERVIEITIPQWNITLTQLNNVHENPQRFIYNRVTYNRDPEDVPEEEGPQEEEDEDEDDFYDRREDWLRSVCKVLQPEPEEFHPSEVLDLTPELTVDLKREYGNRGLQIIVKLANIELTPEKPEYDGGTWHVEGQLNEHICATALYYYDSENISESRLAFRQQSGIGADDPRYLQGRHEFLAEVFGCEQDGPRVQEIGSVLCREGRLLTFPNVLQHRVQPFKLADPTQAGHRKILALFLVDPGIRIISTANVPPQQKDWWSEVVAKDFVDSEKALGKLSAELKEEIFRSVEDFPISTEEAKEIRLKLMEERKQYVANHETAFEFETFSLCEH